MVDPQFRNSPQFVDPHLSSALGRDLLVKVEVANPLGSFKGRGADFFVREVEPDRRLVCSTDRNFGQAIAYAGREHGLPVDVFVGPRIPAEKLKRIRALDAEVTQVDGDHNAAAREHADGDAGRLLVQDGREPAIGEGAGTIGLELLAAGTIDTVVVQVGDGSLITGIAAWIKAHSPDTRVVGVCPTGSPAMALSWREGRPVATPDADTIAGVLSVRDPVPESVARMATLVDDFLLVTDDEMIAAIRLVADTLGILLEPGGAAGVAAVERHDLLGERVAVLMTGQGLPSDLRGAVWDTPLLR